MTKEEVECDCPSCVLGLNYFYIVDASGRKFIRGADCYLVSNR